MLAIVLAYVLTSYVAGVFIARAMHRSFAPDPCHDDIPFVGFVFLVSPVSAPLVLFFKGADLVTRTLGRAVTWGQ